MYKRQEQHADEVPRVAGRDRRALIRRRIEQRFREAEFSIATPLSATATTGRRAARPQATVPVLLSALRGSVALNPWLPALREAERQIVSMVSPALMAPRVTKRIRPHDSGLLATLGPDGLRQTVIVGGRLRFSRIATALDGATAETVRDELLRTLAESPDHPGR